MKRIGTLIAVAALASTGTAFAGQDVQQGKPRAVKMTDAQLDTVAAGQITIGTGLVTINGVEIEVTALNNVANNNQVQVFVPIGAGVGVGVLGAGAGGGVAGAFGRQNR